jgi:hypothetical protein
MSKTMANTLIEIGKKYAELESNYDSAEIGRNRVDREFEEYKESKKKGNNLLKRLVSIQIE